MAAQLRAQALAVLESERSRAADVHVMGHAASGVHSVMFKLTVLNHDRIAR